MNVLILTPDRVGSTLLQRLLTIYMLRQNFGRPVISLHELSNCLIKYYNHTLNQEVLGKPQGTDWGYFQSLPEIMDLLKSVDHFKTSRLAHYHLLRRNDSLDDQIGFYDYLNRNFYIISCRRQNLLEHALSWGIHSFSKKLNVYSIEEKIDFFQDVYKNGIVIDRRSLEKYLDNYVKYIRWTDNYFSVQSYFDYDTHMPNIENYILDLNFMSSGKENTWQDMFGQSFSDWNCCHRMLPNLLLHDRSSVAGTRTINLHRHLITDEKWDLVKGPDWPQSWTQADTAVLPSIRQEISNMFDMRSPAVTDNEHAFLCNNLSAYQDTMSQIQNLKEMGFLVTGVPIKLQSLQEKKQVVKNFSDCVTWYNQWVETNQFGKIYSENDLDALATQEEEKLNSAIQYQLGTDVVNKMLGG
jgi:hypothetical protein